MNDFKIIRNKIKNPRRNPSPIVSKRYKNIKMDNVTGTNKY